MDFFAMETLSPSVSRLDCLRNVGRIVSDTLQRLREAETAREVAADTDAVNSVLSAISNASTGEEAIRAALSTVKDAFGWAYASYWELDPQANALKFALDVESVNEEFRRVTATARFREGEGLSGRAWRNRDLLFVQDIGEMKDCSRAPVAQRAGVKSGVCFPIQVQGSVVGTMDFFAMETLHLSQNRLNALRNVGALVSTAIERSQAAETERQRAQELRDKVDTGSLRY